MSEWLTDETVYDRVVPETWTTKDGRTIRISEMEDSHLVNTIHFLRRRYRGVVRGIARRIALSAASYASTAPDGAADAAMECASATLEGKCDDDILAEELAVFGALLDEARHRKLEV